MLTPKEIYENRKRVQLAKFDIKDIMDLGIYLSFNNSYDSNYEFVVNRNLHLLEQPTIERNQIACPCNHIHHLDNTNCDIIEFEKINCVSSKEISELVSNENKWFNCVEDDIPSDLENRDEIINIRNNVKTETEKIMDFISSNDVAGTSDYLIINQKYNIGNNIINFGCPICGRTFTLLPNKIEGFDEISFYRVFDDGRYSEIYYGNYYNNIHFMCVLLEAVAYHRLITIPNVTGVIELGANNLATLGHIRYEEFSKSYIEQNKIYY